MKKLTLIMMLSCSALFGQHKMAVKLSPLTVAKGQLMMAHFEYNFAKNYTAAIGMAPIMWGPLIGSLAYPPTDFNTGIAIDPEIRWYAKNDGVMDGFFIGLYNSSRLSSWSANVGTGDLFDFDDILDDDGWEVKNRKFIGGFQLGVQKLMGDHFSFDFYSGFGIQANKTTATNRTTQYVDEIDAGGVNLRFNFSIGYQF